MPDDPAKLLGDGKFHKIPLINGFTSQETGFWLQAGRAAGRPILKAEDLAKSLAAITKGAGLADVYTAERYGSVTKATLALESDRWACQAQAWSRVLSQHSPVFTYEFADPLAPTTIFTVDEPAKGPFHNSDIPYVFQRGYPNEQNADAPNWSVQQRALSDRIIRYVSTFSRTGTPAPDWSMTGTMVFSPDGDRVEPDGAFWQRHHCMDAERQP